VEQVVVVGASLAGLRAMQTLRSSGYRGGITCIGAERHEPYDRPPLSKQLLAGEWTEDRIVLRGPADAAELAIDYRLGMPAIGLDLEARTVLLEDGSDVAFDGLIIATGSEPRRLPGQPDDARIVMLRTLDDALAIRAATAQGGARVVVIGAGFIGLEVAATVRQLGNEVTVLEGLPAPLVRGLGADMGNLVGGLHRERGVELRCGVTVAAIEPDGVELASGERVPADLIVVGIGVRPATQWLEGTGLELRDGIVCNAALNAGAPLVYAAGDVVRWYNAAVGEEVRIEHWTNAAEQGAAAAANLLAESRGEAGTPFSSVPFFWSDQYEHRLQFVGTSAEHDEVAVVVGSATERPLLAMYRRGDRLAGAFGLDAVRLLMPYRRLLAAGMSWHDALARAAGS
jgi:NADPH-dependent 2,4-dienoyl-CoA reductase/sulfur reductase-like enzyme